jgi:hypothetical protein
LNKELNENEILNKELNKNEILNKELNENEILNKEIQIQDENNELVKDKNEKIKDENNEIVKYKDEKIEDENNEIVKENKKEKKMNISDLENIINEHNIIDNDESYHNLTEYNQTQQTEYKKELEKRQKSLEYNTYRMNLIKERLIANNCCPTCYNEFENINIKAITPCCKNMVCFKCLKNWVTSCNIKKKDLPAITEDPFENESSDNIGVDMIEDKGPSDTRLTDDVLGFTNDMDVDEKKGGRRRKSRRMKTKRRKSKKSKRRRRSRRR